MKPLFGTLVFEQYWKKRAITLSDKYVDPKTSKEELEHIEAEMGLIYEARRRSLEQYQASKDYCLTCNDGICTNGCA